MNKAVVHVKNVQKVYGKKGESQSYALKGVSFKKVNLLGLWVHLVQEKRRY